MYIYPIYIHTGMYISICTYIIYISFYVYTKRCQNLKGYQNPFLNARCVIFLSSVMRNDRLSSRSPLPGDQVDVMSESRVVFGELLGRRVLSGVLRFGRIGVHHGDEIQEDAQEQGEDDGPGLQHDTHLLERSNNNNNNFKNRLHKS